MPVILLLTYCGEGTGGRKCGGKSDKGELHFDLVLFDCNVLIIILWISLLKPWKKASS